MDLCPVTLTRLSVRAHLTIDGVWQAVVAAAPYKSDLPHWIRRNTAGSICIE